ncbi:hypothetical protein EJ05DRAFT_473725 [Pseudovirgaria hyperparasitica]|uniref:Secreted protein n=1 Tax=Pseudovirgaria hyperparasitica TaxID=470096 RepID=A0A6A6WED5_9PEZI|nr:uncharacterized protein EJ05DRAFT_473725 [Pseudovirgaria hyperparasitica]KAF2761182.1 hypothetical protein EJ05DRAFT_473725 [Pseudovirgaria hyperparasitica]
MPCDILCLLLWTHVFRQTNTAIQEESSSCLKGCERSMIPNTVEVEAARMSKPKYVCKFSRFSCMKLQLYRSDVYVTQVLPTRQHQTISMPISSVSYSMHMTSWSPRIDYSVH